MLLIPFLAMLIQEPPPQPTPAAPPTMGPTPAAAPAANSAPAINPAVSDEFTKAVFFGRKFYELKDYASAFEQFAKADSLQADHPAVLYDMAVVLAKAGRYSEAQGKVDRYVQLYPAGAERPLVGKLQLELEFQRELQKKRQADADYVELFNRGKFLYGKGDLDGALKQFQDAEQQRPNDAAAVFNEAVIFEKRGELAKAEERFKRYAELETDADAKNLADQRLFALETEIEDTKSKILCPFCGFRLPIGAAWCPHCWHGPYFTSSPSWSSRPCVDGASATRATYYSEDRFAKNESLPCLFGGTMLDALRYTPARQHAIQEARKAEGWTYNGEIIQGWNDKQGTQIRFIQGAEYLERIMALASGDILNFSAHKAGDAYLLDREDIIIDAQRYTSHYRYDAANRIMQQQVDYQNASGCNHLISETADYVYQNDALAAVKLHGGYEGYLAEGSPKTDWAATVAYTYDANARLVKEDLALASFTKTYMQKPYGAFRDEVSKIYPTMRVRRPIDNLVRMGDLCAMSGTLLLGNPIDLRPFYAMSPNLAMLLPYGVTHATVTVTYPDAYRLR
jgi:Tfp pilus assembly protein PilF